MRAKEAMETTDLTSHSASTAAHALRPSSPPPKVAYSFPYPLAFASASSSGRDRQGGMMGAAAAGASKCRG